MFKKIIKKFLRETANTYENIRNRNNTIINQPIGIGWSIVVITDGKNEIQLNKLIDSAYKELEHTNYEIIVVGPKNIDFSHYNKNILLMHIIYKELFIHGVPGWITKKKNLGISNAKYDKVVVCHDYIVFKPGWKKGYDNYDNFEVCTNIIVDMDGERSTDWITWDYPGIGQTFVPYDKNCTEYQYLCGIYFVGKRDFLLKNPQIESQRWGEAEDIEWSKKIRENTVFKMNVDSTIQFSKPKWKLSKEWHEKSMRLKEIL